VTHNPKIPKYRSLGEMFLQLVPRYHNCGWTPFVTRWRWDRADYDFVHSLSAARCEKRRQSYLIPGELERAVTMTGSAGQSIRFGWKKEGGGFDVVNGRADFCLIAGALKNGNLTLFYRRLELIGGLHYDLALMASVEDMLGPLRTITIHAIKADAFTRKGGSNETLYKQLRKRYLAAQE
jgi:hypothetical protein